MINKATLLQLIRYGVVGVATNGIGYGIYLLITYASVPPKITATILYTCGAVLSFFLNRKWTFQHKGGLTRSGLKFAIAHLGGYGLNIAILVIVHDHIGWPHQLAQAMAIVIVAIYLFLAFRFFVFSKKPQP